MKRVSGLVVAIFFVLVSLPTVAGTHPAHDLITELTGKLLHVARQSKGKKAKALVRETIDRDLTQHIDFRGMAFLTVGLKPWRNASDEQKQALVTEYQEVLTNTYSTALSEFGEYSMEMVPYKESKREGKAHVSTLFTDPVAGTTYKVSYRLKEVESAWKIYEVLLDKKSLLESNRAEYAVVIKKSGMDGLIEALKKKNAR